jgi:hypothetical protein
MRVTKKNVLIESSAWSPFYGAYVQGATHGRVVAYPLEDAQRVLGMSVDRIKQTSADACAPGCCTRASGPGGSSGVDTKSSNQQGDEP